MKKKINLIFSGGGIRGIAHVGAYEALINKGYTVKNIGGVSAGAVAGSFIGAGYTAYEIRTIIENFDFKKIEMRDIEKKVPAVSKFLNFRTLFRNFNESSIKSFLYYNHFKDSEYDCLNNRSFISTLLKNIIIFSQKGCLLDGDCLEEWTHKVLLKKGIKTFADLRGGDIDKMNPCGYKVRMTAVDTKRGKVVILPDDISFYGINPDNFEVSKAIRMSSSIPFLFKPVEIKAKYENFYKTYTFVDGGVIDNFPIWLIESSNALLLGVTLNRGVKAKYTNSHYDILKNLVTSVHDLGFPKNTSKKLNILEINTGSISFFDFGLSDHEKKYLYNQGKKAAEKLLIF